jgi:hypothetical protein
MLYYVETPYNRSEDDPEEGWHIFVHPATDPWIGKKNNSGIIVSLVHPYSICCTLFVFAVGNVIFLHPDYLACPV